MMRWISLVSVLLVIFFGCINSNKGKITEGFYFYGPSYSPEVTGMKLTTKAEVESFIKKCPIREAKQYLEKKISTIDFHHQIVFVTANAELQKIPYLLGIKVKPAILKKSSKPGIGIYIVNMNPKIPLKVTEK